MNQNNLTERDCGSIRLSGLIQSADSVKEIAYKRWQERGDQITTRLDKPILYVRTGNKILKSMEKHLTKLNYVRNA